MAMEKNRVTVIPQASKKSRGHGDVCWWLPSFSFVCTVSSEAAEQRQQQAVPETSKKAEEVQPPFLQVCYKQGTGIGLQSPWKTLQPRG